MNLITEFIVPSIIILVATIFSGQYGSRRYEIITAVFGWLGGILLIISFIVGFINFYLNNPTFSQINTVIYQICIFSIVTALSRSYEKILKPIIDKKFDK